MNKPLAGQAVRFLLFGGLNTAVTYAIYLLLLPTLDYVKAYGIAYVAGILISYGLNVRFVFRVVPSLRTLVLYPLVYLAQYIFGLFVLFVAVEKLFIPREYALLVSIALSIPLTFFLSRMLLLRSVSGVVPSTPMDR